MGQVSLEEGLILPRPSGYDGIETRRAAAGSRDVLPVRALEKKVPPLMAYADQSWKQTELRL